MRVKSHSRHIRFGIVMPTWNQGKFIRQGILSIVAQKGQFDLDLFVVDGGSNDETVSELKLIEQELKEGVLQPQFGKLNFSWISEKDSGQSEAINKGFAKVSGDVLSWLNSDDRLCPGTIETVKNHFIQNRRADIVVGSARALDENSKELWIQKPRKPSLYTLLIDKECPPQPSIFWRSQAFQSLERLNETLRYTMDFDLWIRFALAGNEFSIVPAVLSEQIYHSSCKSMEGNVFFEKFGPEKDLLVLNYTDRLNLQQRSVLFVYKFNYRILEIAKVFNRIIRQKALSFLQILYRIVKRYGPIRKLGSYVKTRFRVSI